MSDWSANLKLPYMAAAQSQKHVTYNEALELLDAIVQLVVVDFDATTPPTTPEDGQVWALDAGAVGAWAGQDGNLAIWTNGGWLFLPPQVGWRAAREAEIRVFDGTGWTQPDLPALQQVPGVGIGTQFDTVNVLAVEGPASLFNGGADGHQIKINKAAATDTATVLFQTGWSGRAEMGAAGDDDFAVKVSGNGTDWTMAMIVDHLTGAVSFPQGLEVGEALALPAGSLDLAGSAFAGQLPLGAGGTGAGTAAAARGNLGLGTAATADATTSATDGTNGRAAVIRSSGGIFGIGGDSAPHCTDLDDNTLRAGVYRTTASGTTSGTWPSSNPTGPARAGQLLVLRSDAGALNQVWFPLGDDSAWRRRFTAGSWGAWHRLTRIVGTVSQSGGEATGAILQRGSNGNGSFVRFADGTQICWSPLLEVTNINEASGSIFRSSTVSMWTFPAEFSAPPNPAVYPDNGANFATGSSPTVTGMAVRLAAGFSVSGERSFRAMAVGRWF